MLVLLSPAKTLDYETPVPTQTFSQPQFVDQAQKLIDQLKTFAPQDIAELMKLSDKLSSLNLARYQSWSATHDQTNARQAMLAFKGDVYTGLQAETFSDADFEFAQQHLRILSGLYGVLKPLDLMQPYRLEMGTSLDTSKGKSLYAFWDDQITQRLNDDQDAQEPLVINLASNEYFKSVDKKLLKGRLITPIFKDWKGDKYKIISFYAKKARGMMARYIIKNRIDTAESIQGFDYEGYRFNPELSEGDNWVFTRDHKDA